MSYQKACCSKSDQHVKDCLTCCLSFAGHCWVLADNPALAPPHVIDSRSFGPLPASLICGRVMYYGRPTDHGVVQNSSDAAEADTLLLETELDVDKITSPGNDEVAH